MDILFTFVNEIMKQYILIIFAGVILSSCTQKKQVDLIVYNGSVEVVDSANNAQAFAIKDGKIMAVGLDKDILADYDAKEKLDAKGKFIYPGFIDAHCHFLSYGLGLQRVDLVGTSSFEEVLQRVKKFASISSSSWIVGRGWDQNDWKVQEYPDKTELDKLFPNTPVFLSRVDGHAALVNSAALQMAGINARTKVSGGIIELTKDKKEPSGILIDNAMDLVKSIIPKPDRKQLEKALLSAQKNCFAVGLTTVDEAGLNMDMFDLIDSMQKSGVLKMRIYGMLTGTKENIGLLSKRGTIKTDYLDVRSFKFYADGALGSRGACLLKPYSDKPESHGLLLNTKDSFEYYAQILFSKGFQMCTHCIGDSANRLILDVYGKYLKGKNDRRWRIEHAQVVHPDDISKFGKYSIIPSVQPTHATSDMERLGTERLKSAYAYKALLEQNGMIADGSDFPVEDINPLFGFYAAVARQDQNYYPKYGFQTENAISRWNALSAMTIWAAYSNFEEKEKGSLAPGKLADFVILDTDIMKTEIHNVPKAKVIATYIGGKRVFGK